MPINPIARFRQGLDVWNQDDAGREGRKERRGWAKGLVAVGKPNQDDGTRIEFRVRVFPDQSTGGALFW